MKKISGSKKEIGARFRQFRAALHKAQHEMADEVHISQSAIANIEGGKAYPNLTYLYHYYYKYRLDINWLLTGQADMFLQKEEPPEKYTELLNLLRIPFIEQVLNAKLVEAKVVLKDNIKTFFEKNEKTGTE